MIFNPFDTCPPATRWTSTQPPGEKCTCFSNSYRVTSFCTTEPNPSGPQSVEHATSIPRIRATPPYSLILKSSVVKWTHTLFFSRKFCTNFEIPLTCVHLITLSKMHSLHISTAIQATPRCRALTNTQRSRIQQTQNKPGDGFTLDQAKHKTEQIGQSDRDTIHIYEQTRRDCIKTTDNMYVHSAIQYNAVQTESPLTRAWSLP